MHSWADSIKYYLHRTKKIPGTLTKQQFSSVDKVTISFSTDEMGGVMLTGP